MYPSECGRALKYITCKGKNGSSIIPKRDAEKAVTKAQPKYFTNHTTKDTNNTMQKGLLYLCFTYAAIFSLNQACIFWLSSVDSKNIFTLFTSNQD